MMGVFSDLIYLALPLLVFANDSTVSLGSENAVERESRILIQDDYYTLVSKLQHQETELANLSAKVATLESQQDIKPPHVAVNAFLSRPLSPVANQLIVFDDVHLNLGNAYHHGTFVAPYNGTYLFAVTMCSSGGHYILVDLQRNGKLIGQVIAGDSVYNACSSDATVTQLTVGDDVTVQHRGAFGDYIHVHGNSGAHNSFTGVLLF